METADSSQGGDSRKDGLYFVLSGTLQEAVEVEVRPQTALWKMPAYWFDQVTDTDIRKGIKKISQNALWQF